MRTLVLSSWCPVPTVNGAKLRARALLRELARRHEIELITFAEPGEEAELEELRPSVARLAWVRGNPHKPAAPLSARHYVGRRPRSYAATFSAEMARLVADALPRAQQVVALEIGTAVYLERHPGVPCVFEEAESAGIADRRDRAGSRLGRLSASMTWRKYSRYVARLVATFDATTVVSPVERQLFVDAGANPDRLHVVPNGVDLPEPGERTPVPGRLVYTGAVTFANNLEAVRWFAEHVLPAVQRDWPHARLHVTGSHDGVDVAGLRARGVQFEGFLDDVGAFLRTAELALVPLQSGGGTRLKILDAMAHGVPIVSTSKGAQGLAVSDQRHLAIADTPEAFAAAVGRLLTSPTGAEELAKAARALVAQEYTWSAVGDRLDRVLELARQRQKGQGA